jgi:hypothetical protein
VLTKNNVSKDLNTLDKLLNKAVLNKWHSGLTPHNLGISQDRFDKIQQRFTNKTAAAVTLEDRARIYLPDTIFLREGNDSMFNIFSSHKDIDTASHLVHELFHIAGIDHAEGKRFAFDEQIKANCGFARMHF